MDQTCIKVMRGIGEALKLDDNHNYQEAYVQYIECVLSIASNLLQYIQLNGGTIVVSKSVEKQVELGKHCMERLSSLLGQFTMQNEQDKPGENSDTKYISRFAAPIPPLPKQQSNTASFSIKRSLTPTEIAYRQNQNVMKAYKARLSKMGTTSPQAANLSLTIQRKLAENLAIANAQEKALSEKMRETQRRLDEQAARRFMSPSGMSEEEQEQRHIYKKILEYEQHVKWLHEWREKLAKSPKDPVLISQLITQILRCEDHPLTQLLKKYQYKIYEKLYPLVATKMSVMNEVTVPLPEKLYPNKSSDASECTQKDLQTGSTDTPSDRDSVNSCKETSSDKESGNSCKKTPSDKDNVNSDQTFVCGNTDNKGGDSSIANLNNNICENKGNGDRTNICNKTDSNISDNTSINISDNTSINISDNTSINISDNTNSKTGSNISGKTNNTPSGTTDNNTSNVSNPSPIDVKCSSNSSNDDRENETSASDTNQCNSDNPSEPCDILSANDNNTNPSDKDAAYVSSTNPSDKDVANDNNTNPHDKDAADNDVFVNIECDNLVSYTNSVKLDLEKAKQENEALTKKLSSENQSIYMTNRSLSKEYERYNDEDMDDLFDDEDVGGEDATDVEDRPECDKDVFDFKKRDSETYVVLSVSHIDSKNTPRDNLYKFRKRSEIERVRSMSEEAYVTHLKGLSQDVHHALDKLLVMFSIAYEELDSPEGQDQCYASIEEPFFKPIWKYLLNLYRLSNRHQEIALAYWMTEQMNDLPESYGVSRKLCLSVDTDGTPPFQSAIIELKKLKQHYTMLSKLECVVTVCRLICECVENFYVTKQILDGEISSTPCVGADDLLPILTYVVIKSGIPQLVSECQAMSEFIHEG